MSDGFTAWLRQQVEARLALAREASPKTDGHWWRRESAIYTDGTLAPVGHLYAGEQVCDEDGDVFGGECIVVYDEGAPSDAQFEHIAANDPRDTIARCETELAILDEHVSNGCETYPECVHCAVQAYPCRTVRLLGSAYRHRDGYRKEWKPEEL